MLTATSLAILSPHLRQRGAGERKGVLAVAIGAHLPPAFAVNCGYLPSFACVMATNRGGAFLVVGYFGENAGNFGLFWLNLRSFACIVL